VLSIVCTTTSASAALNNTDTQFVAAVNPESSTPATPTVVDRTKIIFQRPDGKILLTHKGQRQNTNKSHHYTIIPEMVMYHKD
jgi:hypothetical protein